MKLIEIIILIKFKGIKLNTVSQVKSIIKIYFLGNSIVKNLIII
jgi:hypothetical protein